MTQLGSPVTSQNLSGALPAAQGGTIVPGTYTLTANNYFDATSSNPADTVTVTIAAAATAGTFDVRMLHGATGCETFTWTVSGTSVTIAMTSPQQQVLGSFGITATATAIRIYKPSANRETVYSWAGAAPDAGADGATADAADDTSSSCGSLTQLGSSVSSQNLSGALPVAQGGTIVPGTYTLTANNFYDATSSSPADTVTLAIAAGATSGTFDIEMLHGADGCETFTWTVSGTNLAVQMTSPQQQSVGSVGYTADATSVRLYRPSSNREIVYTRR